MSKIKWGIGVLLMSIVLYLLTYFVLCKVKYNGLPLVYLFSDYLAPNGGFTYNKSMEWNAALERYEDWDVIVLGASRAERSYDPEFFANNGVRLFNWGTSAQSLQNSSILLKSILSQSKPKEVWLDVVPASFKSEALESSSDLIQNVVDDGWAFSIAYHSADIRALNLLSKRFFCSNERWTSKGKSVYQGRGFVSVKDSMEAKVYNDCQKGPFAERAYITPSSKAFNALDEIISLCQKHGIVLRIIVSPTTPLYNIHDHAWMMQWLNEKQANSGFHLYDFSSDKRFSVSDHFYDEKHLNRAGALMFDSLFLSTITAK